MMGVWDRTEQALAGTLGLLALALALWQVVSRYFLPSHQISYAEEAIVYLLIWAIMLVSSQLVHTDRHVRPDLVLNTVPPRLKRWMEVFNSLAGFVFCVGLTWYGWQVAASALTIDERSATDLSFPIWIYDAALPAGGFLMSIRYLMRLAMLLISSDWKAMLARRPGDELPATG